jgi:hypothetical protein
MMPDTPDTYDLFARKFKHTSHGPPGGVGGNMSGLNFSGFEATEARSGGSMCIEGHFVPELWLLGAPKSGTTSMATDLRLAGIASNSEPSKEQHFFDTIAGVKWNCLCDPTQVNTWLRSSWLAAHPEACPTDDTVHIIADYTPDNLRMSLAPEGWEADTLMGEFSLDVSKECTPAVVANWYAEKGSALTFVVLVRDPIPRYLSAFYFRKEVVYGGTVKDGDFETSVNSSLAAMADNWFDSFIWPGLVGRHIENYLQYFAPQQFIVSPNHYYYDFKCDVFSVVSQHLGVLVPCEDDEASSENSNPHPPLEEVLQDSVKAKLEEALLPENERFVGVLTRGSLQGMSLPKYTGTLGNKSGIQAWLLAGW